MAQSKINGKGREQFYSRPLVVHLYPSTLEFRNQILRAVDAQCHSDDKGVQDCRCKSIAGQLPPLR